MKYLIENQTCSECLSPKFTGQSWSILQTIINIWVFMFAFEEFQQVKTNDMKRKFSSNQFL